MKLSTMYVAISALITILVIASTESVLYGLIAAIVLYCVSVVYRSFQDRTPVLDLVEDESEVSFERDAEFEVISPEDLDTDDDLTEQPKIDRETLEK